MDAGMSDGAAPVGWNTWLRDQLPGAFNGLGAVFNRLAAREMGGGIECQVVRRWGGI